VLVDSGFGAVLLGLWLLIVWIRIPNLSFEYFNSAFLHKTGSEIGRLVRINRPTKIYEKRSIFEI